jgi:hypothetical protein
MTILLTLLLLWSTVGPYVRYRLAYSGVPEWILNTITGPGFFITQVLFAVFGRR